nr:MAG TPA: Tumor necrosis factor, alpha-induced protein-A20 domain, Tumor necrosis factor [Caudoviricetes sp.]
MCCFFANNETLSYIDISKDPFCKKCYSIKF